jgi:hypothetical protein
MMRAFCWEYVVLSLAFGLSSCGSKGIDGAASSNPTPATLGISPGTGTLTAIGATIQLTANVKDQNGQAISNPSVNWSSSATSVATVNSSGLVTAVKNGTAQIQAAVGNTSGQATVTVAQSPKTIAKISGDQQNGSTGLLLGAPLIVQVNDSTGHGVPSVGITFSTTNGSVTPTSAVTDAGGQAQGTWRLGDVAGPQSATAATQTSLSGSPITFTASATVLPAPTIVSVSPDTLVEGQPATVSGTNFSTVIANDQVTIDGVAATVTIASATSLTVTVPTYACSPVRLAGLNLSIGAKNASKPSIPIHTGGFVGLAVGEEAIVQDPTKFCLQFRAASAGPETYIIGLTAPAESPSTVLPFKITNAAGLGPVAPFAGPAFSRSPRRFSAVPQAQGLALTAADQARVAAMRNQLQAEAAIRAWEAENLPRLQRQAQRTLPVTAMVPGAPTSVPVVGDTILVRVPTDGAANLCTTYVTVKTVVRVVGNAGIWLYDVQNPTTDSLTLADIQSASNQFDNKIFASDTTQFGHPTDLDNNGHVFIVLTWQVNKAPNILGFVFGGDLFPGSDCPESNGGELYYGQVPDPLNQAGTGARTKSNVLAQMPTLIAHEFTHIIQFGQRLILHNGQPMALWEMEGQATFAEELAGNAVLGNASYQNYGRTTAFGAAGYNWYSDEMLKWAAFFGDLGANNQAANAPDLCTVYGNLQLTVPCDPSAFYGASWILQRYLADRFGPSYAGGLVQFTRDWIQKNPSLAGGANMQALTGVDFDQLFVQFMTALALDDEDNGTGTAWIPTIFRITSWNSADISSWISTCCQLGWLNPPVANFSSGSASRSVRGGSTAYLVLTAAGSHPAAAMNFTDLGMAPLSTALRPALWVARIQ